MSSTVQHTSSGIGFTGLLQIVFITLKILHLITWSWWWVLAPIWITCGIVVLLIAVALIWAIASD